MKTFIIALLFLGMTVSSYSQEKVMKEGIMKVEDLPAVVIKSAGDDFSVYLPDMNADQKSENWKTVSLLMILEKTMKAMQHT